MADINVIYVIIGVIIVWLGACIMMNKKDKPKNYPETEAKSKIFCETIKENKINGTNSKT